MFLTAANLTHYLIGRGLMPASLVVDGNVTIAEAGRRNRNYKAFAKNGRGLFIKQIKNPDAAAISTLTREASCYRIVRDNPAYGALSKVMTGFVDHDANRHCLILELLPDGENLNEHYARTKEFPVELAELLGSTLGSYHAASRGKPPQPEEMATFPRQPAWILSYHNSTSFHSAGQSGGVLQLLEIVRSYPDLRYNLDRLRNNWNFDCLIHGDMKWDNCLVHPGDDGKPRLKIIDWELVDYGDACWDVGSILQSYLTSWVYAMPLPLETSPERLVRDAAYPLEAVQPAIRAFWDSYRQNSGVAPHHSAHYLIRSIEYGAARLVQTAFESLYFSPAMTPHGATLLQLSQNILRSPAEAAAVLFGLKIE